MPENIPIPTIIAIVVAVVAVLAVILSGYVKAPPDQAYIISGLKKESKVLIGRAGIRVPIFERLDKLYLGQMTVDIKTEQSVPTSDFINVNVDAVAKVRISPHADGIKLAAKNFLNKKPDEITRDLQDSLQGNMREIIGTLSLKEINTDLHSLQAEVGGDIGATYPYSDPVALVCNDEGKLIGLDLNRGLRDENGEIYDIVAGTFLVVGLGEEDFASLSPELIQKYTEQFKTPERFMQINGNIVVLPVPAEKQDLAYLPDRFETGERVQTPRGSFQVTAMSREQMEAGEMLEVETLCFMVPWFFQPMGAGPGEMAGSEPPEDLRLTKAPPRGTSFVARVHGDSMKPTYHDGDLVFVHSAEEIQVGRIGAFFMDGQQWIKELGDEELISHNPDYDPIPMREDIRCQGLVLGVCDESYFE